MCEATLDQDREGKLCRDSNAHVGAAEGNRRIVVERVEKACWNFEEGRKRMSAPKMGPTEMRAEIIRLHREGKMPSLEDVLEAVAETRAEYREKILAARQGKKKS
jgi:hypothetical protein